MDKRESTENLAAAAMGRIPGDIIIRNGTLVNVLTGLIEKNTDIIIKGNTIAFVGNASVHLADENTKIIDAKGKYILPGLIDSHMHVESSMVDLPSFAAGILPHGTTTICPDNHEMTNVFGVKAVELFKKTSENLPLKVYTAMPVCVPSLPGMEDAGASINAEDVKAAYKNGWAELQGEQMNFPGVIFGDPEVHAITREGLIANKVLTGHFHSPGDSKGLNAFIASGITACHESTQAQEALEKVSRGMYAQLRYGTAWLDLPNLVGAVLDNPEMDTRMFTLVTDDVTPSTIVREGHLIRVLREAVRLGIPPVKAVQMVTINAAQLLKKSDRIGSVSPGRAADILIADNLNNFNVELVISNGITVAEKGRLLIDIPKYNYPGWATGSVHIPEQNAENFIIKAEDGKKAEVRVIRLIPGMVFTKQENITLTPENGCLHADPEKDIAKISMIYRHKAEIPEKYKQFTGFITGLNFRPGYAYASTVSHDSHNLLVIGTEDKAMALAANTLRECGGGLTVVENDRVIALMELPLAGLMSLKSVKEASEELENIENALKQTGCPHESVEMTISLLGLVVLGELHISNRGLVELKGGKPPEFTDLFL
jgi:adenine deaminase